MVIIILIILAIILQLKPEPPDDFKPPPPPSMPKFATVLGSPLGDINQTLHIGWNMVSMPGYSAKNDVYFTYENISYNWTEAISIPLIVDVLYTYNGSDYVEVNAFLEMKGYWLYTFVEPVYISSDPLVLYCSKIYYDGNDTLNCTRLLISPMYETIIHCASITAQEVVFYFYDVGEIKP